jgi:DNA polymerase III subunit beta
MRFTCDRDTILKEISVAQEIISSRNALSILSNVYLSADDGALTIRATDLKVSFETRIPVDAPEPGNTTVFCDKLAGILRNLPQGEIEFIAEHDTEQFVIRPRFKKIDFRLKSIAADKYPELQPADEQTFFELPQDTLMEMITQTIFAVSDDETRYFMNGVYLEYVDGRLMMVATDGRRLSHVAKTVDGEVAPFPGVIVPPKVLNMVRKQASGEGTVRIAVTEKSVYFDLDSQKLSSSLIEGQFPNYQRVIPDHQDYSIRVDRAELQDGLKRVSLLVEKSRRIYMTVTTEGLVLTSEESEIGKAREEISCEYTGPETTLALNYLYLVEPLRVIDTEHLTLQFTESNKAITINPDPTADYFHIVMPMQLD